MTHFEDSGINGFLRCATTHEWIEAAVENMDELLIDHANCEKKAASTALALMFRYADHHDLVHRMSRLAREELRHFEQVYRILHDRGISYRRLAPSGYAAGLHRSARRRDPHRLADLLIIGAYIEARSCERFSLLAPLLDDELERFYTGLLASEARHYQHYIGLARQYCAETETVSFDQRIAELGDIEAELINTPSQVLRFHSGPIISAM